MKNKESKCLLERPNNGKTRLEGNLLGKEMSKEFEIQKQSQPALLVDIHLSLVSKPEERQVKVGVAGEHRTELTKHCGT